MSCTIFPAHAAMNSPAKFNLRHHIRVATKRIPAVFFAAFVAVSGNATAADARDTSNAATDPRSMSVMRAAELPPQGREILQLIRNGGPFKHAGKDGSVFGNFERILPKQPRGHYKEYTVPTPGAKNRAARRIVCGGDVRNAARSTCYYTHDHYASFKRIQE